MTKKNIVIIFLIGFFDFLMIWYLRESVRTGGSDKGIILYWLFYPLIMVANLIFMFTLTKDNPDLKRYIGYIVMVLAVLFLPLLFTIY